MLDKLYKEITKELEEVYTLAEVHAETNDIEEYKKCTEKMVQIADILGIKTTQFIATYDLKPQE